MPQRTSGFFPIVWSSAFRRAGPRERGTQIERIGVLELLIREKESVRGQMQHTRRNYSLQFCFTRVRAEPQDCVVTQQLGDVCCFHA